MGDSIVLTRDSSENPMKQTEILGYCQFAINCRRNTDITITKEGEVVNLRLTNTGFEPRKLIFTNPTQQEIKHSQEMRDVANIQEKPQDMGGNKGF